MRRTRTSSMPVSIVAALLNGTCLAPLAANAATGATWSVVSTQDPGQTDNRLYGVACSTPSTCWAVGDYFDGTEYRTLIERSTAAGWVVVPSPNSSSNATTNSNLENALTSVTCVASGPCFAAGYWYDGQNEAHTLIEENSGSGWALVKSADVAPALVDDILEGITCVSAVDCWAVGESLVPGFFGVPFVPIPGTPAQTLTEHWNGRAWSVVSSADTSFSENILDGVACSAAANCWAVGIDATGSSAYDALIEHYNGSAWSIVGAADPSAQLNELDGVWCGSDDACHAAGIQRATSATQTLMEANPVSQGWVSDSGANTSPSQLNGTNGITCTDDSDCWAVGEYDATGNFLFHTLVERRTAAGWSVAASADVSPSQPDVLWAVACGTGSACWAAGYSTDSQHVNHTLIEGTAPSPPPAQVPEFPPIPGLVAALAAGGVLRGRSALRRSRSGMCEGLAEPARQKRGTGSASRGDVARVRRTASLQREAAAADA